MRQSNERWFNVWSLSIGEIRKSFMTVIHDRFYLTMYCVTKHLLSGRQNYILKSILGLFESLLLKMLFNIQFTKPHVVNLRIVNLRHCLFKHYFFFFKKGRESLHPRLMKSCDVLSQFTLRSWYSKFHYCHRHTLVVWISGIIIGKCNSWHYDEMQCKCPYPWTPSWSRAPRGVSARPRPTQYTEEPWPLRDKELLADEARVHIILKLIPSNPYVHYVLYSLRIQTPSIVYRHINLLMQLLAIFFFLIIHM